MPKISVIVPVYNAEKWLNRCVDSILAQTFTDFELILVNDGSTDTSGQICDSYAATDQRIRVIHKPNGGVSSARNAGINIATGSLIAFVDADDSVRSQYLTAFIDNIGNADICIQGIRYCYSDNSYVDHYCNDKHNYNVCLSIDELYENRILPFIFNKIFKTNLLKAYNIRFDETLKLAEDLCFILKYFEYIDSVNFISDTNYNYSHPTTIKQYTSNSLASVPIYCQSLANIMKGNMSDSIFFKAESDNLKQYAIYELYNHRFLPDNTLALYKSLFVGRKISLKDKFFKIFILNSSKLGRCSFLFIRFIHLIATYYHKYQTTTNK